MQLTFVHLSILRETCRPQPFAGFHGLDFCKEKKEKEREGINKTHIAALKVKLLIKSLCELLRLTNCNPFRLKTNFCGHRKTAGDALEEQIRQQSAVGVEGERGEGEKEESCLRSGHLMDYVVNCPNDVDIRKIMFAVAVFDANFDGLLNCALCLRYTADRQQQ